MQFEILLADVLTRGNLAGPETGLRTKGELRWGDFINRGKQGGGGGNRMRQTGCLVENGARQTECLPPRTRQTGCWGVNRMRQTGCWVEDRTRQTECLPPRARHTECLPLRDMCRRIELKCNQAYEFKDCLGFANLFRKANEFEKSLKSCRVAPDRLIVAAKLNGEKTSNSLMG